MGRVAPCLRYSPARMETYGVNGLTGIWCIHLVLESMTLVDGSDAICDTIKLRERQLKSGLPLSHGNMTEELG